MELHRDLQLVREKHHISFDLDQLVSCTDKTNHISA